MLMLMLMHHFKRNLPQPSAKQILLSFKHLGFSQLLRCRPAQTARAPPPRPRPPRPPPASPPPPPPPLAASWWSQSAQGRGCQLQHRHFECFLFKTFDWVSLEFNDSMNFANPRFSNRVFLKIWKEEKHQVGRERKSPKHLQSELGTMGIIIASISYWISYLQYPTLYQLNRWY